MAAREVSTRTPVLSYAPRLLPIREAAAYLGVSEGALRTLSIPRKKIGEKPLYDRLDLDAYADALLTEGEARKATNSCDGKFGRQ